MKIDADEKEVHRRRQARANSVHPLRQGYVPQGPATEHSALEQGLEGDSEARARRGVAVSDADREPPAQYATGRLKEI